MVLWNVFILLKLKFARSVEEREVIFVQLMKKTVSSDKVEKK